MIPNQIHNGIHNVTQKIPFSHTHKRTQERNIFIVQEDESKKNIRKSTIICQKDDEEFM